MNLGMSLLLHELAQTYWIPAHTMVATQLNLEGQATWGVDSPVLSNQQGFASCMHCHSQAKCTCSSPERYK